VTKRRRHDGAPLSRAIVEPALPDSRIRGAHTVTGTKAKALVRWACVDSEHSLSRYNDHQGGCELHGIPRRCLVADICIYRYLCRVGHGPQGGQPSRWQEQATDSPEEAQKRMTVPKPSPSFVDQDHVEGSEGVESRRCRMIMDYCDSELTGSFQSEALSYTRRRCRREGRLSPGITIVVPR